MNTGRRVLLSAGFLALTVLLTGSVHAQQDGSHKVLRPRVITPEEVRKALERMGAGEPFGNELDPFQQMVKDYLLKNNPGFDPKQADDIIKKLTGDKQLMDQLKQIAKQKQTDPGRPGKLTPDELQKLFNGQNGKRPDLPPDLPPDLKGFRPPKIDPKGDPFDPKLDPKIDPKVDPKFDPKFDPFDPKIDPKDRPDPLNPKVDPKDPGVRPPDNGKDPGKQPIELDKNPFPEPEEPTDPRTKSLQTFAALWEKNIGPLNETPEVQRALMEALGENGFDFDMKDERGNSIWDLLKNGDSAGLDDFFGNSRGGSNWGGFGNWELPKFGDWFGSRRPSGNNSNWFNSGTPPTPRPPTPSSSWGLSGSGLGGTWTPFVLLLLVILAVFLWFQLKHLRSNNTSALAFAGEGLGPWPVDPRAINTREDVVKAFEYLSVLICGPSARNWTHSTIAAALADLATTHGETATMLARLYELARYAPLDEPLTREELIEARKLVCSLAGVSY